MSDHGPGNDPIDELSSFGAGFTPGTGGDMPLSAAAVRRRGDQIRRRRTALVAGASALAVAAVAVPIFAVVGGDPNADRDNLADDPDKVQALGAESLLTDDDTVYSSGNDWFTTGTTEGEGGEPFNICAREDLTDLGAETVLSRDFELRTTQQVEGDVPDPTADLNGFRETVAEFPDAASAVAAYDTVTQWLVDCEEHLVGTATPEYRELQTYPVETGLGDNSTAQIIDAHYGPVPEEIDPFGDSAFIAETGLVRVGNRIAVLASVIVGQDYTFLPEEGGTPVNRMIPPAADRLQPSADPSAAPESTSSGTGTDTDPSPETSETSGTSGTTGPAIADDFPLAAGWPEDTGDEVTAEGPSRSLPPFEFTVCDEVLADTPEPSDRLLANWSQPEDYRSRQLSTYATEEEAAAALEGIVGAYRACPEEASGEDGYARQHIVLEGTVGDESWIVGTHFTFEGNPAIGLQTNYLIRVGTALLFISGSNEGSAPDPEATFRTEGREMADEASDVIGEACVFGGRCS